MRIFQALHKYDPYIPHFEQKYQVQHLSFEEHVQTLLKDRFYALHLLKPVLERAPNAFYALWNYEALQYKWAEEQGWKERDLKKILYAQIEAFQPEVFYNMSPTFFELGELEQNLAPNIIRICWSASPFYENEQFKAYQTRLTNLPLDVRPASEMGFRSDLFQPAYDPAMEAYAANQERPIDLFFYGQYARAIFKRRNEQLDQLLEYQATSKHRIELHLQYRIEKEPVVNIPYVRRYWQKIKHPSELVRSRALPPVYGLDLYEKLGQSKLVFNAGVDFSKQYKVNMRNLEVLGCGAQMLSDEGIYPKHFEAGKHFSTYKNMPDFFQQLEYFLEQRQERMAIAKAGHEMVKTHYNKEQQWQHFQAIVASL
jgi:hypothetical protein